MTEFDGNVPAEGLVVLKFYAKWCGPCRMLAPVFDRIVEKYADDENVKLFAVNTDEQSNVAQSYKILSLPTTVFIKDGEEVNRIIGLQKMEVYEKAIDDNK